MYLIHWPRYVDDDFEGAWREFEKIKDDGLSRSERVKLCDRPYTTRLTQRPLRSIGVSNFSVDQIELIIKAAKIKPAVNQVCHS
jgi:diketogulonate reductase-like aldo/keto reductase